MSTDLKTGAQFSLRVLVRGLPLGEGATFELGGSRAVVLATATPSTALARFPDAEVEDGDLEAVVWCETNHIAALMTALTSDPQVIAVESTVGEPDSETGAA